MGQKASLDRTLIFTLMATGLLLSVSLGRPVRAGSGVVLRSPFNGTYRVTAYFDHVRPTYCNGDDGTITIYNGEVVAASCTLQTGEPYPYDGHDGWDWSMYTGTSVLAAATGTVVLSTDDWEGRCYGSTIVIDHGNGYYTQYSHLSQRFVGENVQVTAGQLIAASGNSVGPNPECDPVGPHLHFGVRQGGYSNSTYAIDPFGWRGLGRDPLFDYNGRVSTCLWAGMPGETISCGDITVEDDGAGWSESPPHGLGWFTSVSGNGYREHYATVVQANPNRHAWWQPVFPELGFYQVQAFIPANYATTSNARYWIDYYQGNGMSAVKQNVAYNQWVPLGAYEFAPGNGSVYLNNDTDESQGSRWIAADGMRFTASVVALPDVRALSSSWFSTIVVRNNSGKATAYAGLNYYNILGGLLTYDDRPRIAPNAIELLDDSTPVGFSGPFIAVADQGVSVLIDQMNLRGGFSGFADARGILPNETSTSVQLPVIMRFYGGSGGQTGYYTTFRVQNTGSEATTVRVTYYDAGGTSQCDPPPEVYLPAHGQVTFNQSLGNCPGDGFIGSAVVTSLENPARAPLAVHVFERHTASSVPQLYSYEGFPSGSTTLYFPNLLSRAYGSWSTSFSLRNTGSSIANVTLTFTTPDGSTYCSHSLTIRDNGSFAAWLPTYPPEYPDCDFNDGWIGSATITSDEPLVGVVNQVDEYSSRAGTYSGIASGSTTVVLPYLPNGYYDWSASFTIQNLGSANTDITIVYYLSDGTVSGSRGYTISAGSQGAWYLPEELPGGYLYSAVVTSDGQPIGGIVNVINTSVYGDGFTSYNGDSR